MPTQTIAPTKQKPNVCDAWVTVSYFYIDPEKYSEDSRNLIDSEETAAQIKVLNARRKEYCNDK